MLKFIDSIDKLDENAAEDHYYIIMVTITGIDAKMLTLNDGDNEFELEFATIGDVPEVTQHYYAMIDVFRT